MQHSIQCSGLLKTFSFYSLADLLCATPAQLLWETFSHAAINAQRLLVDKYTPLFIVRNSFIQTSELEQRSKVIVVSYHSSDQVTLGRTLYHTEESYNKTYLT